MLQPRDIDSARFYYYGRRYYGTVSKLTATKALVVFRTKGDQERHTYRKKWVNFWDHDVTLILPHSRVTFRRFRNAGRPALDPRLVEFTSPHSSRHSVRWERGPRWRIHAKGYDDICRSHAAQAA